MESQDDYSGFGNKVLYRMCQEQPLHDSIDVIQGKLWLIGRSYAASIERKAGKNFKIKHAAEIIKNSKLDERIKTIADIDRLDNNNLSMILGVHSYFVKLLKEATGVEKRSLASKYLHFHAPKSVLIYDSIVNTNLRSELKGKRFTVIKGFDKPYTSFALRAIAYRDDYEAIHGSVLTPRQLDIYLYNLKK